jgi:type II secretory pathway component GspD/PulD (secretin)
VLRLWHTEPQSVQELATVTRSTADIRELSINTADRSITFNGTPQQNAIAEWLVPQLDISGPRPFGTPYKVGAHDVVRVLYVNNAESPQQLMEIATVARSLAEVPRAFLYQPAKAIIARGTADQIALIEWLVPQLDVTGPRSDSPQHYVGGKTDDIARVFYLNHTQTAPEVQEMTTAVRSTAEIRRAFTYITAKAVVLRATADQIALAEFLIQKLNKPLGSFAPGSDEYRITATPEGVVRLFAIDSATISDFHQRATSIRAATGIMRAFTYSTHRALILRGTPEQLAEAAQLVKRQQ